MVFSKKFLVVCLVVILTILLAVFVYYKLRSPGDEVEAGKVEAEKKKVRDAPVEVEVAPAFKGDLVMRLRAPGEAETNLQVKMIAEESGFVKNIFVNESKSVGKGDVLVELDEREFRLDLENAQTNRLKVLSELMLEQQFAESQPPARQENAALQKGAEENYEKARLLFQKGEMSLAEFEQAEEEYLKSMIDLGGKRDEIMASVKGLTQAEINVKKAQLRLEKAKIKAPFSGIVSGIKISPGEYISAGTELFTLVNINKITFVARILESEISKIQKGRKANLFFSAYPGKPFGGEVQAVSPVVDPEDKTCRIYIGIPNPQGEIKPGMHADAEIVTDIYRDRLLVPQDAIVVRMGRKLVFVVEDGLAKWHYVDVGLENEQYVEILEGVEPGDQVTVSGHITLAHDTRVRVVS